MCDLNLSDASLTEKFKRDFNEQFHILVRMHLSFILDQTTDENEVLTEKSRLKKWSLINKKSSKTRGTMEGAPLTHEGICQVYQLIEFLKKEQNIIVEGIFRRTGSLVRQQELRNLLSRGITLDLEGSGYSVHDCASVLKGFLAELPDPLLTEAHYPAYCQIAELCCYNTPQQDEKLLTALQLLFLILPTENKTLLKDILDLLHLTASHEAANRMSPENLATLFTPHLLCPRKLTPEQLHINSQSLAKIVTFMIVNMEQVFKVPPNLVLEFRARYEKKRNLIATNSMLNESVNDAANTVFTFVDHERTAKENETNTTETALAQLYAHIQSLPESSKKRKLVKQFNKENGHGTPLQVLRSGHQKNKSFGDSIKKHIFQKSLVRSVKKARDENNTPIRTVLFCTNCDTSTENLGIVPQKRKEEIDDEIPEVKKMKKSEINLATSTPACLPNLQFTTPEERRSMSPITRSTQRMSRAMQETMMTPRSRKPVLLVSGTNINTLTELPTKMDELPEQEEEKPDSISETFREYLESRSMVITEDSSFSSRTDDFISNDLSTSKMTESLLKCLDGDDPDESDDEDKEKKLVLKPKKFDANGQAIVYETSF